MQESENNNLGKNGLQEPLPEPTPPSTKSSGFMPRLGVNELTATYEMIVNSRKAIKNNSHWSGEDLEVMAMLGQMLRQMEAQYRVQLELAKTEAKEAEKRAREAIKNAGGTIGGEQNSDSASNNK